MMVSSSLYEKLFGKALKILSISSRYNILYRPKDIREELVDEALNYLIEARNTWKVSEEEAEEIVDHILANILGKEFVEEAKRELELEYEKLEYEEEEN